MNSRKEHGISYFAAHITTIVSITLVLLIVGTIALVGIAAGSAGNQIKRQVELSVIMQDSIDNTAAANLAAQLRSKPYTLEANPVTKEQAMKNWQEQTGENLEEVFGVNPLSPEIALTLRPEYALPAKIKEVSHELQSIPGVEGVAEPDADTVGVMISNIEKISIVFGVIALALICISFMLINNTVRLSIYSKRFSIHTMQLVGATDGFIRRPFVGNSVLSGLIAAAVASVVLWGVYLYLSTTGMQGIDAYVPQWQVALVVVALFLFSTLMSGLAALFATNRYLGMKYDELFK